MLKALAGVSEAIVGAALRPDGPGDEAQFAPFETGRRVPSVMPKPAMGSIP